MPVRSVEHEAESSCDPFYSAKLSARCPDCGATFDPTALVAAGRDGWTGEPVQLRGGATYRFATVIDCGKFIGERPLRVRPRVAVAG